MGTFTWETGLGLLAVGLIVIAIGATIFFMTVNRMEKKKKQARTGQRVERTI